MNSNNVLISIIIATRNRWEELQKAIESCLIQDYDNWELLVYDDASDENIANKVKTKFPTVKTYRSNNNVGQLVLRNKGFRDAKGKYIFSLDDDAFFNDSKTLSQVVDKLEKYPKVAVVALPFYEPKNDRMNWQGLEALNRTNNKDKHVANFTACAAAFRRDAIIGVKGYREFFFFHVEESDLAIRLIDKGWDLISSYVTPLTHTFSDTRDLKTLHINGPKNSILFTFINTPLVFLLPRLFITTMGTFWHGLVIREPLLKLQGIIKGYMECWKYLQKRQPVKVKTWLRFRRLLKKPENYLPETYQRD